MNAVASLGPRWVAIVNGEDRPGTLTALASVFSSRGVSFESLATGAVDGEVGSVAVTFTTTPRRQALLIRTVARLAVVSAVRVRRADDPAVLAAAIVHLAPGLAFTVPAVDVQVSGDLATGPLLVEGSLADVSVVVGAAKAAGATLAATVVLSM